MTRSFEQHLEYLKKAQSDFLGSRIDLKDFRAKLESLRTEIDVTNPRLPDRSFFSLTYTTNNKDYYSTLIDSASHETHSDSTETPDILSKKIALAILTNNDKLLTDLLQKNDGAISQITDHRSLINLAVELRSTNTFNILLDHGFDPRINQSHSISPIALAAYNQGEDFVESYCKKISEKFGRQLVTDLANEIDKNGNNALGHALLGRSYLSTVELLLTYGVDASYNFQRNAELAIKHRHIETLGLLLKHNKGRIPNQTFLELSNFAKACNNIIVQRQLAANCSDISTRRQIDAVIDSIENIDQDIFEICKHGSLQDFQFLTEIHKYQRSLYPPIAETIDDFDSTGKNPLFYVLTGNCYDSLVLGLLNQGALITNLTDTRKSHQPEYTKTNREAMDALTICVRTQQSKTLGTILRHPAMEYRYDDTQTLLLTDEMLGKAVEEMISQRYLNARVVASFITNISPERLQNMNAETLISLTKTALEFAPKAVEEKAKSLGENYKILKIDEVLSQEPRNSQLRRTITHISSTVTPPQTSTTRTTFNVATEGTPLLPSENEVPNNSICSRFYNALMGCISRSSQI